VDARVSGPLVLLVFALAMGLAAQRLGLGALSNPGPGFFPLLNAVGLALTALMLIARASHGPDREGGASPWLMVLGLTAGIAIYGIAVDHLGFLITSFLFLLGCWVVVAAQPFWRSATLAAVTALSAYLLFDWVLGVRLPSVVLVL